jgi:hypothetical protein
MKNIIDFRMMKTRMKKFDYFTGSLNIVRWNSTQKKAMKVSKFHSVNPISVKLLLAIKISRLNTLV